MTEFKHEADHTGFVAYSDKLPEKSTEQLRRSFTAPNLCFMAAGEADFERLRGMANHGQHLIRETTRLAESAFKGAYDMRDMTVENQLLMALGVVPNMSPNTAIAFTVCSGCLASALAHAEELAELIRDVQEYVRRHTPA